MQFKQPLVIRQPNYSSALSPIQTDTRNVCACWWFGNKGQAKITTQFEKDGYTPIEVCKAMWDIDNSQCTGVINSISIRLEQYVDLKAGDGQNYNNRHILDQKNYDGLGANQSTGGMNRYLELDLSSIKQQAKSFDDGKVLHGDDLYLAERIQPTSNGSIVKLYYQLTVFANYGSCCAEEPHWTIPLTITPPPLPSYGKISAPAQWAPTMYSWFNFSLPSPGQVMAATVQPVVPLNASISFKLNEEEKYSHVSVPVPVPISAKVSMPAPMPMPVPVAVKVSMPAPVPVPGIKLSIDTDLANRENPIPSGFHVSAGIRDSDEEDDDYNHAHMNVNMNMPGLPGMNMEMHGNVTTSATYSSESTVNGVTTKTTYHSSNAPVPVPVPAPVQAHGEVNMGVNMGFPSMAVSTSIDDSEHGHAHAQVNFPGMSMNMKMD